MNTKVVDYCKAITYHQGGKVDFRLTVTQNDTELTAVVDLFDFLTWALRDGIIDSYSAEDAHEEVVILPVPDGIESPRSTAWVRRLYAWLESLPLSTFERALNEWPTIWIAFDQNMEPINA